jgi:zona occludens toxin
MGRWLYEFPECDTNNSWKRCENKRRYTLPKHVFDKYKSASMHIKPVRNRPVMLYLVGAAILALLYLLWTLYSSFKSDPVAPQSDKPAITQQAPAIASGLASSVGLAPPPASSPVKKIDDRVDWIPRVSNMPETAPAFDDVRKVQAFPVVAGGVCFKGECKCFTQQGTNAGLNHDECLIAINNPRFDAYSAPVPVQQAQSKTPPQVDQVTENGPEIKHAVAVQNHEAQQAVTRAARTAQLNLTGSL